MENNQVTNVENVPSENTPVTSANTEVTTNNEITASTEPVTNETAAPVANEVSAASEPVTNESIVNEVEKSPEAPVVAQEEAFLNASKANFTEEQMQAMEAADDFSGLSKEELVKKLEKIFAESELEGFKLYINKVKDACKTILESEIEHSTAAFIENGGAKEEFVRTKDEWDLRYEAITSQIREKMTQQKEQKEVTLQTNLHTKERIINDIKDLLQNSTDISSAFTRLHELQSEWRSVGTVPPSNVKMLWENYNFLVSQFYEFIKINKELRDMDSRKNLDLKLDICIKTESLVHEESLRSAVQKLKTFHDQWKEIGQVPTEYSEEVWQRFKNASDKVFDLRRASIIESEKSFQGNLELKKAIVAETEDIAEKPYTSHKEWQEASERVLQLFEGWKKSGPCRREDNEAMWERFKKSRDSFFTNKENFYTERREKLDANLQTKIDLCVRAESLKDSPDWRATAGQFAKLQEEWKQSGPVAPKNSEQVWERFKSACDTFFSRKTEFYASQNQEEAENLTKKEAIIERAKIFELTEDPIADFDRLKEIQADWFAIGFVPFKEKERIIEAFAAAIDPLFAKLKKDKGDMAVKFRRSETSTSNYRSSDNNSRSFNNNSANSSSKNSTQDKLKKLEQELLKLENNATFFANSKSENPFKQAIESQIQKVKEELTALKESIKAGEIAEKQKIKEAEQAIIDATPAAEANTDSENTPN